jgi:predicted DNA-binding transcriptional regulator YafY
LREELRSFSVDAISHAQVQDSAAREVPDAELDDLLGSGYGIFAGRKVQWTRLRFTPECARWVASERWHPHQRGRFDPEGHWLLDLPYADPRELVMDILRHVPDVEVLWPDELAGEVRRRLEVGLQRMGEAG